MNRKGLIGVAKWGIGITSFFLVLFFLFFTVPTLGANPGDYDVYIDTPANGTNITGTYQLEAHSDQNITDPEQMNLTFAFWNITDSVWTNICINTTGINISSGTLNGSNWTCSWDVTGLSLNDTRINVTLWNSTIPAINNTQNITIDGIAPTSFSYPSPTPANDTNQTQNQYYVNVTFDEVQIDTCLLELSNTTGIINYTMTASYAGNYQSYCSFNVTDMNNYNNKTYFYVYANDTGGLLARSAARHVTFDNTTPSSITYITANNTNTNSRGAEFNFTVVDNIFSTGLSCTSYLNGSINTTAVGIANNTESNITVNMPDGTWIWNITCNDSAGNINTTSYGNYTVTVDTVAPTISSFSCSPSSVTIGETISCSCSATDTLSGLASTSYASYPSTLTAGTITTTCTATDNAGNQNSASFSYRVSHVLAGGDPLPESALPSVTKIWNKIEPGALVNMTIDKEGLELMQIRIQVRNRANNVEIKIEKLAKQPATITKNVTGKAYQYVKITPENIEETNLEKSKVKFKVNKTWISNNNIDKNKVYLNRYKDDKWNKLTTTWVNSDTNYEYYEAETPGFSVFAISGEETEAVLPVCTAGDKRCTGNDLEQCKSDASAWEKLETCTYGCDAATKACKLAPEPVCTPGEKKCVGNDLEQCKSDASAWEKLETCTYGCDAATKACKSAPAVPDYTLIIAAIIIIIILAVAGLYLRKGLNIKNPF